MQYKHMISSNKIKVFLSSSMKDKKFLEQRNTIVSFLERMPLYEIFAIENTSSDQQIKSRYINEIKQSDVILLILQGDLREGVANEFYAARRNDRRIFAFVHSGRKSKALKNFIRDEVNTYITSTEFVDNRELIDKIEKTLLEDLVKKYVMLHEENIDLYRQLERYSSQQKSD